VEGALGGHNFDEGHVDMTVDAARVDARATKKGFADSGPALNCRSAVLHGRLSEILPVLFATEASIPADLAMT
jgi:hypothetical protein